MIGIGIGRKRKNWSPKNKSDLWFKANNDLTITDLKGSSLEAITIPPCYNFDGDGNKVMTYTSLLDAYEVEIVFKTTSTTRMGIIAVNGFGTIIIYNNVIIAGSASIIGNSAAGTYTDGLWHTIKIRKTGTANVYTIYLDGVLKTATSNGNWRDTSLVTVINLSSLPLNAKINRITLRDVDAIDLHEWRFIEGEFSSKLYDCIGNADLTIKIGAGFGCDVDAVDHARTSGASLILDDTNNVVLVPFKNGVARDLSDMLWPVVLAENINGLIPSVSYWINFNPDTVVDSRLDVFDKSNATIFDPKARIDYVSAYLWRISDLNRINLISIFNAGYRGRLFAKFDLYNNDKAYSLKEIFNLKTNAIGADQTKVLNYTKDSYTIISTDVEGNKIQSVREAKDIVETALKGGLYTRFYVNEPLATIFENHGFRATFVVRTPATYKGNISAIANLKDLQDRGHDVGYWYDVSMTCIQLYDASWASDFLVLDADYNGKYDDYGSPLWGVGEIIEALDGNTYMGLNTLVRYKKDDIIIQPVDGTSNIIIPNIPASDASATSFVVLMPNDIIIPELLRGKWVHCMDTGIGGTDPATKQFELKLYEYLSFNLLGLDDFVNPGATTLITSAGLYLLPTTAPYTSFGGKTIAYMNGPNVRARYYNYLHAIMAFEEMGLERPYTVGETRNITDEYSLSTVPLSELGFISGGVDPVHYGHSIYMQPWHRWNLSTLEGYSTNSLNILYIRSQGIGFNGVAAPVNSTAEAFIKLAHISPKNRWIVERQITNYPSATLTQWNELLTLCEANDIPVQTMRQAVEKMFDASYSPYINPIPLVHIDKNTDSIPDGYQANASGTDWAINPAIGNIESGYGYFHRTTNGVMFLSAYVGGICPGKNYLKVYGKGKIGDSITVTISGYKQQYVSEIRPDNTFPDTNEVPWTMGILTFTITQTDTWELLLANGVIIIPDNIIFCTYSASLVKGGTAGDVYCGQMFMSR
jgi:hypothetical protein